MSREKNFWIFDRLKICRLRFLGYKIENCARQALNNAYHKPKNIIFARHLLMTRTQKKTEKIDEYVYALNQLARDCQFQDVRANDYKDDLSRDAFINGIGILSNSTLPR